MPFETDQGAHRHAELPDLLGAAQIRQIDDEAGGQHVGAELHMTKAWSLAAKFDGEFASRAQTYAGTATLRYAWRAIAISSAEPNVRSWREASFRGSTDLPEYFQFQVS